MNVKKWSSVEERRDKALKKLYQMTKDEIIGNLVCSWMTEQQIEDFIRPVGQFKEWLTKAQCSFFGKEEVTARIYSEDYKNPKTYFVLFTCYNCYLVYRTKKGLHERQVQPDSV